MSQLKVTQHVPRQDLKLLSAPLDAIRELLLRPNRANNYVLLPSSKGRPHLVNEFSNRHAHGPAPLRPQVVVKFGFSNFSASHVPVK